MKKLFYVISLLFMLGMTGCSNEDYQKNKPDDISGKWELEEYNRGFAQASTFKKGDVIATFSTDGHFSLHNSTDVTLSPFENTETYSYELLPNSRITINDMRFDYYFEKGKLFLGYGVECDGPCFIFHKQQ